MCALCVPKIVSSNELFTVRDILGVFAALCRVADRMDGALMGFEQEAVSELYASVWGNRSTMQRNSLVEPMVSSSCSGSCP